MLNSASVVLANAPTLPGIPRRCREVAERGVEAARSNRIITLIEEGGQCVDIAQQLHAVENAVRQATRTFIQDHIGHCLEDTVSALSNGEHAQLEASNRSPSISRPQ